MKKAPLILFLIILASSFVSADRYEDNYFRYGTIGVNDELVTTTTPITNVNILGLICSSENCSSVSGNLWSGILYSGDDYIQLIYPYALLSPYGYGIYMYKEGYIPYGVNAYWWGTCSTCDPVGPYNNYLTKKQICFSNLNSFDAQHNGGDIDVLVEASAPIERMGLLEYTPVLIQSHFKVDVLVNLEVVKNGVSYYTETKTVSIPYSGTKQVNFDFNAGSGKYDIYVYTSTDDAKCIDYERDEENDTIIIGCTQDSECDNLDSDYCIGDYVKRDEGKCVNYECQTETITVDNCNNGLYCDGEETCSGAACVLGIEIDCSGNDLSSIATCENDPDNNPFTWDFAVGFTSECDEGGDVCTTGTQIVISDCDIGECGAECEENNDCSDTYCDYLDGCEGNNYYEYSDVSNSCLGDCGCEDNGCGEPTIYSNDARCTECQDDFDCSDLDSDDYCEGNLIKDDKGICVDYRCMLEITTKQDCDNSLYCDGQETCDDAECVSGEAIDCSEYNLASIETCNNDPDNNPFTWDYFIGFTSVCNEENDGCTLGQTEITNTCDIELCGGCETDSDCEDENIYTTDICLDGCACGHEEIECITSDDCDDSKFLTKDICVNEGTPESYCRHKTIRDILPRQKFFISKIRTNQLVYDEVKAGDQLFVDLIFENIGKLDTKWATIRLTQHDLGISRKLGPFRGPEVDKVMSRGLYLDIPEYAEPGVYTIRITLSDLNGIKRVRHRDFRITK